MTKYVNPANWPRPRGYNNGVVADGPTLAIAGQIGWNEQCEIVSDDFFEQAVQALQIGRAHV